MTYILLFWVVPLGLSAAAGYALCEMRYAFEEEEREREEEFARAMLRAESAQRLKANRGGQL